MSRKTRKSKDTEGANSHPSSTEDQEAVENGTRQTRKRGAKTASTTEEENPETIAVAENPKKKAKKSVPFNEADWSTLYDHYIHNQSKESLTELIVNIFLYFSDNYIDEVIIRKIVVYIADLYHNNYYHSFVHATHVLINAAHYLLNIQQQYSNYFTTIEKISVIYAALIHDVDHFGVTNSELIAKKHKYAILYNDQSVAEMNSLAIGLGVLNKKGYELLKDWKEEERVKFRNLVIELVLCTDIADPHKKRVAYFRFEESLIHDSTNSSSSSSSTSTSLSSKMTYDIVNDSNRTAFLMVALRTADVSSSVQGCVTFRVWAKNYFDECYEAASNDAGPSLEIESYCHNQIAYMEGHVKSCVQRLASSRILSEAFTDSLLSHIKVNIEDWEVHGHNLYVEWENSHPAKTKIVEETQEKPKNSSNKGKGKNKKDKVENEKDEAIAPPEEQKKFKHQKENKSSKITDDSSERKSGRTSKRKVVFDI